VLSLAAKILLPLEYQQVDREFSFFTFCEREEFTTLDKVGRIIFTVQSGRDSDNNGLSVGWDIVKDGKVINSGKSGIEKGAAVLDFNLAGLEYGRYEVKSYLEFDGNKNVEGAAFFRYVEEKAPLQSGKIKIVFPKSVVLKKGTFPVTTGIPFPKGALWNKDNVRVVDSKGKAVDCQTIIRSRWGYADECSIRWLGLDFNAGNVKEWWPERKSAGYFLEYGPKINNSAGSEKIVLNETDTAVEVDTGAVKFSVSKKNFNLLENVLVKNKQLIKAGSKHGLYLIDHEGSVYRAANDKGVKVTVEEKGDRKTVIKAEGWYVKDGSAGETANFSLPTDKLCKFTVRLEAYAGKPYVKVLNTWVITYDSFTVRLKDLGFTIPFAGNKKAVFGIEEEKAKSFNVGGEGVYLIQHLNDAFAVEDGKGKELAKGKRSSGWVRAEGESGTLTVGHKDTWQRFPKEMEVLPGELKFHVWPAHGKDHPEINPYKHEEIHKLWFAHQGKELNLVQPWEIYFSVAQINNENSRGVYSGGGQAMAGVHASAMGVAITSEFLIDFTQEKNESSQNAECFQSSPHAVAAPEWTCESMAMGHYSAYDPVTFEKVENVIEEYTRAYWEMGNEAGEYGMFLYRPWHHTTYDGDGKWKIYRTYNATHHYEAFMPWMLYARSGDPFYLTQGSANMRLLTDVQMIHYDNTEYPHKEFHGLQKRLVGSTKHTNGFNTWGADHMITGHGICYGGMMLAYYLTGDLRIREVIVDEWQNTLLYDMENPEYIKASRADRKIAQKGKSIGGARDVCNSLGEYIDLYQLTYNPLVLAKMAPAMKFLEDKFKINWGRPFHNVLTFYKSEHLKEFLVDSALKYREDGKPKDTVKSQGAFYTHCPHNHFALAALSDPEKSLHIDSFVIADVSGQTIRARNLRSRKKEKSSPLCQVPDYVIYLPTMMKALKAAGGKIDLSNLNVMQPLPSADLTNGKWTQCIIKEEQDQDIELTLTGAVRQPEGVPIVIYDTENNEIKKVTVKKGDPNPFKITIPKDEKIGQYVIFIKNVDGKTFSSLRVPLSSLPEIYHVGYWTQDKMATFFFRSRSDTEKQKITFRSSISPGKIYDFDMNVLAQVPYRPDRSNGELIAEVDSKGAWVAIEGRYIHVRDTAVIAVSPKRWFYPDEDKLKLMPPGVAKRRLLTGWKE
jgi:hypothetical protein